MISSLLRRRVVVTLSFSHQPSHFSSAASSLVQTVSSISSQPEMEKQLRDKLGPHAQLLVREQRKTLFSASPGSSHAASRQSPRRRRARRLDIEEDDDVDEAVMDSDAGSSAGPSAAAVEETKAPTVTIIYRSSVTFRQCGFNVTVCTAESGASADEALRAAFNGAVNTDVAFFNPTLAPREAAVFDRLRFLALGMGRMIRFSIGGGGDDKFESAAEKQVKEKIKAADSENDGSDPAATTSEAAAAADEDESSSGSLFTCTAYVKDDWEIGRARDKVLLVTAGRSAHDAFSSAVMSVRDRLTTETEEGAHALEDVREMQRVINHRQGRDADEEIILSPTVTPVQDAEDEFYSLCFAHSASSIANRQDKFLSSVSPSSSFSSSPAASEQQKKLLHPELFQQQQNNQQNYESNSNNNNRNQQKNYTAKVTVTDKFSNSYFAKSGDMNRSALAAYRSCVNQIYKREVFLTQRPAKSFFCSIQWQVEHLVWYSGLARNLDWDMHFRMTMRSSSSAGGGRHAVSASSSSSSGGPPTYIHGTLHIGPVELAFADGTGRYRVMLNCYCNVLERLLTNCPPHFSRDLPIPTVERLYAAYTEADRFQPADALKGAIKGLSPLTVLGAVANFHFGTYYQMHWERRESQKGAMLAAFDAETASSSTHHHHHHHNHHSKQQNLKRRNQNEQQHSGGGASGASEDVCFVTVTLPTHEGVITLGDCSTVKPGTRNSYLSRPVASRLACQYALRDNFPLIYQQVKDREDFKRGMDRRVEERKQRQLRALPREQRIQHLDSALAVLRELGAEDHDWANVDVDCVVRNSGLWVATCFARLRRDGTTRDLLVSRPSTTKAECRKRVVLETAHKFYPREVQQWLAAMAKKHPTLQLVGGEYSKADIAAVMGADTASAIKPYDPVGSGSLIDQMLAFLGESGGAGTGGGLRVAAEIVVENPSPVSTLQQQQQQPSTQEEELFHKIVVESQSTPSFRCHVLSSDAAPDAHEFGQLVSLPGAALFPTLRECITNTATAMQVDTERIRLLLTSFEDYRVPQVFRPQDLAEWLIKAHLGTEAIRVDIVHTQNAWCGVLRVAVPVKEAEAPSKSRGVAADVAAAAAATAVSAAVASSSSTPSSSMVAAVSSARRFAKSVPRVHEWVELSRSVARTKREAVRLCYMAAAISNAYAHLTYLSRKSLEQQGDADAVLSCDLEQHHHVLRPQQVASYLPLAPSPLAVLRAALKADGGGAALRVSVMPLDKSAMLTTTAAADGAAQQQEQQAEKANSSNGNDNEFAMLAKFVDGDVPLFECDLYAGDKLLARSKKPTAEAALDAAVLLALDEMLSDGDMGFWRWRWSGEVLRPLEEQHDAEETVEE